MENLDLTFIRYIREETKSFSNKVIFFSAIIILLSLKIITIQELEFGGFKVQIKEYILIGLVIVVNIYFYLQFLNSVRIDELVIKLPNEFESITDEVVALSQSTREKMEELTKEFRKNLDDKNVNEENFEDFKKRKNEINDENVEEILENWIETSTKLSKRHKNNVKLNVYFPNFCFWIASLTFTIRILKLLKDMYWA